jgi:hypothetical protein
MATESGDETYGFLLKSLDNGEGTGVVDVLHDEPVDSLLVLAVDASGLDQLELEPLDAVGIVLGVHVDGECVDHGGRVVKKAGWEASDRLKGGIGVCVWVRPVDW